MCGICGIKTNEFGSEEKQPMLDRMNSALYHRGPDDDGFYLDGQIGMAMRRLSVIDIKTGQQPMFNEDRSVVVVFNGEIYNFQELRKILTGCGHQFETNSDTEVIVHGYEEWGDTVLNRLNGMFAIALWDQRSQRLLLARDRMGKKPLYWMSNSRGFFWGSEMKALLNISSFRPQVSLEALHHYLTLQYIPDPLTIYQEIFSLPAAHKLVLGPDNHPEISPWWQLSFEPKLLLTEAEAIEQSQDLLGKAVARRLISEVPLGVFLSGGIDSSIIVALMAKDSSATIKTFSIGFTDQKYSETQYSRAIAERYQTEHHEFLFNPSDLIDVIDGVVKSFDQPFADSAALPLFALSKEVANFVTVVLSGDGGDETVAGYRRYRSDQILWNYGKLPPFITQRTVPAIANLIPVPSWIAEEWNPVSGLRKLNQYSRITHKASILRWGDCFDHVGKIDLYNGNLRESLVHLRTEDWLASFYDNALGNSLLDRTLYTDHVTYLSGDLLPKTDRVTMAHSLEARAPFLDPEWVEWTARLPDKFKVRGLTTKWLLKKAFASELPETIIRRGKQGFGVPIGSWLRTDLRAWSEQILLDDSSIGDYFRKERIATLWNEHQTGKQNHSYRLWALIIFALWNGTYLSNVSTKSSL